MQSRDMVGGNVEKIAALFPHCVTERIGRNGKLELAIDFDKLRAELSDDIIEEGEERYQFTWPDKRVASRLANEPVNLTLRPCREESVGKDGTPGGFDSENLYIEGDNLDVLKVLRETYLGSVKMIYIDPPYNTGNDFVYHDEYTINGVTYKSTNINWDGVYEVKDDAIGLGIRRGAYDEDGNQILDRMQRNTEANGRLHTDWLNMIYPRLKVARDLLTEDGVIFISIGDEELQNLRKVCDEIFGEDNYRNQIIVRRGAKSVQAQFDTWDKLGQGVEYLLFYTKNSGYRFPKQMKPLEEFKEGAWNNHWRGTDRPSMRYPIFGITPKSGQWRWGKERSEKAIENYKRMLIETAQSGDSVLQSKIDSWYFQQLDVPDLLRLSSNGKPEHYIPPTNETLLNNSWADLLIGSSSEMSRIFDSKVFDTPKLTAPIMRMLNFVSKDALILDFFSGSATTAHAVMKLNAEDGGSRKFIMVQLPEVTDEKSEARKAGYANICEIGKERIRRAGKKIKEEAGLQGQDLDIGFRVLKLDSSNMEDVFYTPDKFEPSLLDGLVDNIKADRSGEDMLFQVMLDLGIELSSSIRNEELGGRNCWIVDDGYLIACFDKDVNETTIEEMAKLLPTHLVIRDASAATDNVLDNFDQIIESYSAEKAIKTHVL